jgi:hypothetical protein
MVVGLGEGTRRRGDLMMGSCVELSTQKSRFCIFGVKRAKGGWCKNFEPTIQTLIYFQLSVLADS